MLFRATVSIAALVLLASPSFAQIDPETKTPYLWRVVVKADSHPLLSPAFREQLKKDLLAALQPGLGAFGTVDVVDLADVPRDATIDPLWQQFVDNGFGALNGGRDLNGVKTHFLKLEYRDGMYHLESRQHDGFSGLASPIVRKQTVRAPELVGRTAGLMLERDFGLAGSIEPKDGKVDEVKVTIRGGALGSLDRFVKSGDVFAVSKVTKTNRAAPPPVRTSTGKIIAPPPGTVPPPGLTSVPREFTLLHVIDVGRDGTLRCKVLTRFEKPIPPTNGAVAYRCVKLGTVEGPVSVRLVSESPGSGGGGAAVTVRATELGFGTPPDARDTFHFQSGGLYRSARDVKNLACVTVSLGPGSSQIFPVPVLGPDPVSLPFEVNPKLEERAAHLRAVVAAATRVADARNAQTICFEETAKLIDKKKNADALKRAKGGYDAADATIKSVSDELLQLKDYQEKSADAAKIIKNMEQNIAALDAFNKKLSEHVDLLKGVVAREDDPTLQAREKLIEAQTARLSLILARGDIDEAINAYDQLLTQYPDGTDAEKAQKKLVKDAQEKLRAEWKPKSEAHAKARDYLLKTWPAVATIPDFKESLAPLTAAVDLCMKPEVADKHALRKLLSIFSGAAVKLNELAGALDSNADGDRKLLADAKKVGEDLAGLENKITEFLK